MRAIKTLSIHSCDRVTAQDLLAKVAREAVSEGVRDAAKKRVVEPVLIESIGAWIDSALTAKVTDQALLAQIVKGAKDADVRTTAIGLLNDQEFLARLATSSAGSDDEIRAAAVARLNDQVLLGKLAIEDKNHAVRTAAIEKLEDQDLLAKIAVEEPDEDIREAAARRVEKPGRPGPGGCLAGPRKDQSRDGSGAPGQDRHRSEG